MCSETSEAVGTTWEHAQLEFQKFLKIRILLLTGAQGAGNLRATTPEAKAAVLGHLAGSLPSPDLTECFSCVAFFCCSR